MSTDVRNFINEQMNNSFVENILNPDNLQLHGNINRYDNSNNAIVSTSDASLEEFKNKVKIWIRLDNEIKQLTSKIKVLDNEKKARKKHMDSLTPSIINFMSSEGVDEINSRDGKLLSKKSVVKSPLSQKLIREQLYNSLNEDNHEILDGIFKNREKVEKVTLRRVDC